MKKILHIIGLFCLLLTVTSFTGCGGSSGGSSGGGDGDGSDSESPPNTPPVPTPASLLDMLPDKSDYHIVGLSKELEEFEPYANQLRDGRGFWIDFDRRVRLACPDHLIANTGDPSIIDRTFIDARPYLLHQRYWKKLFQVVHEKGQSGYDQSQKMTSGVTNSTEHIKSFSETMGVSATVGGAYKALSGSVTASYEATETETFVNAISFSEKEEFEEIFWVDSNINMDTLYAVWVLVERFSVVDEYMEPIHMSDTLRHADIEKVESIEVHRDDVLYFSTTNF